ncbi:MAG: hypothetical protein IKQ75_07715 [Bacteroidales bacterium]|nr:hypothetical protein [Bacteroidales bacterium]
MMNSNEQPTFPQLQAFADTMSGNVHVSVSERDGTITFAAPRGNMICKTIIISLLGLLGMWLGIANLNIEVVIVSIGVATAYGLLSEPSYSVIISRHGCRVLTGLLGIQRASYDWKDYKGPLVYMRSLNGREPSPKEFCLKFSHINRQQEVRLSDLTRGKSNNSRETLQKMAEFWEMTVRLFYLEPFETEFQITGRNAIFGG